MAGIRSPRQRTPGVPARAMGEAPPGRPPSGKPRHGARARHRGLRASVIAILAVVVLVGGGITYAWFDLNGKLHKGNVDQWLGSTRPPSSTPTSNVKYPGDPFAGQAVNILVLGTDSRDGNNGGIANDDPGGSRSDTTFIAHVSADRTRVDVVSIPRDTWITIPDCQNAAGHVIDEAGWMHMGFNAAYAYGYYADNSVQGGAACAIRAAEAMSNVLINAYIVVDFQGFVDVVDAVGGLDVTLLCAVKSSAARIDLPKGQVHLDGLTAVGLARARKGTGLGDGSDLQRIRRQHAIFDALLAKVYAMNYVTDFPKLYGLTGSLISSVTTNLGENLLSIAGFGYSLKNLKMDAVTFITIPVADAGDGAHVVISPGRAEGVWTALRDDKPLPESVIPTPPGSKATESPSGGTTPGGSTSPGASTSNGTSTGKPTAPVIQVPSDCD